MKHVILFLILTSFSLNLKAQTWQWAISKGSNVREPETGRGVLVSPNGNIYSYGNFYGSITLDSTYYSVGNGSRFISEFSQAGVPIRSVLLSAQNAQSGMAVQDFNCDHRGNLYLCGDIEGSYYFGPQLVSLSQTGFVVSLDSILDFRWIKPAADQVYTTAFDETDNIYLAGTVSAPVTSIDTFLLYNPDGFGFGNRKIFAAMLDTSPYCQWVKQGMGGDGVVGESVMRGDNYYLMGNFDSCVVYDTASFCANNLGNSSFVMQTSRNGGFKWLSKCPSLGLAYFSFVHADAQSNLYALGWFDSTLLLGNTPLQKTNGAFRNFFLAKYDSVGTVLWTKQLYCNTDAVSKGMFTDDAGNTYIAGGFSGTAIFGNDTVTAQGTNDMFVTRYNTSGDCLGVVTVPNAICQGITQDANGNAILTGSIKPGTANFGSIPLTSNGGEDFFIAKLSSIISDINAEKTQAEEHLVIYPNPNNNSFTVLVPDDLVHKSHARLSIYDHSGRTIKEEDTNITGNRITTNIGEVQKGMYTVVLSSDKRKFTGRVAVE